SDPRLWEMGPYLLTVADTNQHRIRALARYFCARKMKKAAVLVDETLILSHSYSQTFLRAFEEAGGEVVAVIPYTGTTRDFRSQVAEIRKRSPDFVFLCDYRVAKVIMLEQELDRVGYHLPVATQVALFAPGLGPYRDIFTSSYFHPDAPDATVKKFVADYRQAFGLEYPSHVPASSYDALKVAALALEQAGTDRKSVNAYLTSIGDSRPPYQGVTGRFGLGRRLELRAAYLVEVKQGRFELISVDEARGATD
ncbi:MAG: ABC transporter substrate-binding protein, partial [Candidatus Eremiobacterota bacterium]